ncbi:Leucine-rich repeat-containing protein 23 [Clonorchis sinensis]|uniref:Leucine-rich repeat-containing protein 23 n=1 Tax=Clonorchis sinensis TaxID=79923 RepID=A0A8T1MVG4_CLOSI|nr:Leucine-rich repeat-containing protein 23 [Clonorchis sinensis]
MAEVEDPVKIPEDVGDKLLPSELQNQQSDDMATRFALLSEEKPPSPPPSPIIVGLDKNLILSSLCFPELTVDGLSYAPAKFICNKKGLNNIDELKTFVFLRHINIAFNDLTDLTALYGLRHLLLLDASHNLLKEFPVGNWPSLTHLMLSNNHISELTEISFPNLKVLSLNNNHIRTLVKPNTGEPFFHGAAFPQLHTLELAHNKLSRGDGRDEEEMNNPSPVRFQLPKLKALFLGQNALKSFAIYRLVPKVTTSDTFDELAVGEEMMEETTLTNMVLARDEEESALGELPQLSVLHLRRNKLRDAYGLTEKAVPALQYLNMRENRVRSTDYLDQLSLLSNLRTVILLDNPVCEMKDYRLEMRVNIQSLRRLDKETYTKEENQDADLMAEQRRLERSAAY